MKRRKNLDRKELVEAIQNSPDLLDHDQSEYPDEPPPSPHGWHPSLEEDVTNVNNYCQWAMVKNNYFSATNKTYKSLKAGVYNPVWLKGQAALVYQKIEIDDIYIFENSIQQKIIAEVIKFWSCRDLYKKHNLLHRRGFLLHGTHGSGKTSVIQLIIQNTIQNNGLVIDCNTDPDTVAQALQHVRQVEPFRPIVCIFEDIDALIEGWGESLVLSLLDGEKQADMVLNIATSNHPDKLDNRLTNRPRRFDKIIKIDYLDRVQRKLYLEKKNACKSEEEYNKWLNASDGFTFAALADMVISINILEQDFDETVSRLKLMQKNKSVDNNSSMGFAK